MKLNKSNGLTNQCLHSKISNNQVIFEYSFLKKILFIYFLDKGKRRKEERETSVCGCLWCTAYWGPGLQPRLVPCLGIKPETIWFPLALSPLSHTSQGLNNLYITYHLCKWDKSTVSCKFSLLYSIYRGLKRCYTSEEKTSCQKSIRNCYKFLFRMVNISAFFLSTILQYLQARVGIWDTL